MHIASESSLKKLVQENAEKIIDEPEQLLKVEDENQRMLENTKDSTSASEHKLDSNGTKKEPTCPTQTNNKPQPKKSKPFVCSSKKKWPIHGKKIMGIDSYQGFPARCHTHTIIFLHGFSGQGNNVAWYNRHSALSKHARVVAPSAPLYPAKNYPSRWYHNIKHKKFLHSWTNSKDYVNSHKKQIQRIWQLIHREAKALGGDYKRIFLVGYSQGADMAIHIGVGFNKPLGGIVALMNWAWGPAWMGRHPSNEKTPIYAILGKLDTIIRLHDAKYRMNDQFWQSNRRKNVRARVLNNHGHFINHYIMRIVNHWINYHVKKMKN